MSNSLNRRNFLRSLCFICGACALSGKHTLAYSSNKILPSTPANSGLPSAEISPVKLKMLLTKFGYLRSSKLFSGGIVEYELDRGIRRYQFMHSLPLTGNLDAPTLEMLTRPRCGMPDWNDPLGAMQIGGWNKTNLSFYFQTLSKQPLSSSLQNAVRMAFETWELSTNARITFREVSHANDADISVAWVPAKDPDRSLEGLLVAHADYPPGYSLTTLAKTIPLHFDDEETIWSIDGSGMDMQTIALHEIGHCLGLVHSNDANSVMFATVSTGRIHTQPQTSDIESVFSLYL